MKMSPSELKGILEQKNKAWEQQTLTIFIPIWRYESVRSCLYTFNTRFDKFEKKFLKYVNKLAKL